MLEVKHRIEAHSVTVLIFNLHVHLHVSYSAPVCNDLLLLACHFQFSTRVKGTLKSFEVKLSDDKLASLISVLSCFKYT